MGDKNVKRMEVEMSKRMIASQSMEERKWKREKKKKEMKTMRTATRWRMREKNEILFSGDNIEGKLTSPIERERERGNRIEHEGSL
ncbi:uncharacterized protein MONOS_17021 [Monocercomonoides exilis]|uniref:uncharacterized protein n=1 Tax=Monocercomonoides exilis TaxID=2049356 RepID=UPI0035595FDD|nr:hypothetical protein MONOS_17021 [Monocercomonoides exilis]